MAELDQAPDKAVMRLTRDVIVFVERSYWIVGVFTLYWFIRALVGVYRIAEVDLPLIGPCKPSEAIIFTLLFLWAPLLALHLLTRAYQRRTVGSFPGILGDNLAIPRALRGLRWLVFFVLVVFPTGSYVLLTVRAFTHLQIVWKPEVDANPWDSKQWKSARDKLGMLKFSSPPGGVGGWIFHGDWRWKSHYDEWREEADFHPRVFRNDHAEPEKRFEQDASGTWHEIALTPLFRDKEASWSEMDPSGAKQPMTLVEIPRLQPLILQKNADGTFTARKLLKQSTWDEPVVEKKLVRVWISAWPGLQPLLFVLISAGLLILLAQHLLRGWRGLRRELLSAPPSGGAVASPPEAANI